MSSQRLSTASSSSAPEIERGFQECGTSTQFPSIKNRSSSIPNVCEMMRAILGQPNRLTRIERGDVIRAVLVDLDQSISGILNAVLALLATPAPEEQERQQSEEEQLGFPIAGFLVLAW